MKQHEAMELTSKVGMGRTLKAIPDDIIPKKSSCGLPRTQSYLNPIYDNRHPWEPVLTPPGVMLNKRGFKHLYNPWNKPFQREMDPEGGGPHLKKRRALEVILQ
jgi:hypothetical protein